MEQALLNPHLWRPRSISSYRGAGHHSRRAGAARLSVDGDAHACFSRPSSPPKVGPCGGAVLHRACGHSSHGTGLAAPNFVGGQDDPDFVKIGSFFVVAAPLPLRLASRWTLTSRPGVRCNPTRAP